MGAGGGRTGVNKELIGNTLLLVITVLVDVAVAVLVVADECDKQGAIINFIWSGCERRLSRVVRSSVISFMSKVMVSASLVMCAIFLFKL